MAYKKTKITKSDDEIMEMAIRDISDHLIAKQKWRDNYVKPAFAMYDGDQWTDEDKTRQEKEQMPCRVINKTASVIDAVAGFEVQNRTDIEALPMEATPDPTHMETANNGIKWCESTSDYDYESSYSFADLIKCGAGATVNHISYMSDPNGIMRTERIFPLLFLFDPASRRMNMIDARWLGYAEIVDKKSAAEEAGLDENESIGSGVDDSQLLCYFDTLSTVSDLAIRYEYQWRETVAYYRVKNTAYDMLREIATEDPLQAQVVANYLHGIAARLEFDPKDSIFTVEKDEYKDIKEGFEALGIEFDAVEQKRYSYFRAKILGDKVIDKGQCINDCGFDIAPMTGKYSEINQSHYGMTHSMRDPQMMLNQVMSDFEGYLRTIPKGGVEIEETAVNDMKAFKETWHKAREITVYADGALSTGRVKPKQAGQMPTGIIEMIQLMLRMIPEMPGVTPDFMGIYDGNQEVSGILQSQRVRQGLTVLATYFDAKQRHASMQGEIYLSALRILAENAPGRLIRNMLGESSEKFLSLSPESLASEYMVEIKAMAQTPNEQQDMFTKLIEIGSMLEKSAKTAAGLAEILPVALPYSQLNQADTDKITAAVTPQQPPPPDPVNQALMQAETAFKNSMAQKNAEEAKQMSIENLMKAEELRVFDEKTSAEITETYSKAELNAKRADSL